MPTLDNECSLTYVARSQTVSTTRRDNWECTVRIVQAAVGTNIVCKDRPWNSSRRGDRGDPELVAKDAGWRRRRVSETLARDKNAGRGSCACAERGMRTWHLPPADGPGAGELHSTLFYTLYLGHH
ncbi:unnamed protein product [Arctia plantaginis]|uniref:Uncharacterized protein n=1 Tax=Arctia plantaginis TaxID=874455 RepID=A0A8S0ZLS0_ARCPL|nr:unnamed protein product [Arctia plantaginis]